MQNSNVQMVIFDWAGTMVDYGSQAPMDVFFRSFEKKGIHLTKDEINGPMGMEKKCHIRELLSLPRVAQAWKEQHGRAWTEEDVEELYSIFETDLYEVVLEYTTPIDGVPETMKALADANIKIGSTTGYTSAMMKRVVEKAAKYGITPSSVITPDLVGNSSRPAPFMIFECMKQLNVQSVGCVVKVGDTQMDILEGKNAGAITVGLLVGSNAMGLSKKEFGALNDVEKQQKMMETRKKYEAVGADYIIETMEQLPNVIRKQQ